jgi:ABC-2 type transport system permease protein
MVVITVFLTSALFSLGGFINAMLATKFDDISIVPTFVLTPLTYLGGVFYSIDLLPSFWQGASMINPILYMVNGFRYGILGVSDVNPFISLGMIIVFIVLLAAIALRMLARGKGIRH